MTSQTPFRRLLNLASHADAPLATEPTTASVEERQVEYVDRLERLLAAPEPKSKRRRSSKGPK